MHIFFQKIISFWAGLLLVLMPAASFSQGGNWVWVKGSDSVLGKPVYGEQGVSDINNNPGGLWAAGAWVDLDGNFWLFGGMYDSISQNHLTVYTKTLNDLWKYDPHSNIWTWMKGPGKPDVPAVYGNRGVPSPLNNPDSKAQSELCWTDNNNNLWLYGGLYDNLWEYNIHTNNWTWISGNNNNSPVYGNFQQPAYGNTPGARFTTTAAWVDEDGNLWFFGGQAGMYYNLFNDLWKYNVLTGEWAWMNGPQGTVNPGNYGTKNIESPSNVPPCRLECSHWKGVDGCFYLFGGYSGLSDNGVTFNDLWRYDPKTNNWAWIGGDSSVNSYGQHTQICYPNGFPDSRCCANSSAQASCSDIFYLFGGMIGKIMGANLLDDLWAYSPSSNGWDWLSGSQNLNKLGNYGTMGVMSATNQMPARYGYSQWVDKTGDLWIFGGIGSDTIKGGHTPCCQMQTKNDLWKFVPDTNCIHINHCPTVSSSVDIFIPNAFSPNGDGNNDRFTVFGKNITQYEIKIFDRAGELMYKSNDPTEINDTTRGWDGTYKGRLQDVGVYVYFISGQNAAGITFSKKGDITLIR